MFPFIRKAITDMAYDSGCINRYTEEKELVERVFGYITDTYTPQTLENLEFFLVGLTEDDFDELICGQPLFQVPNYIDEILNDIFENL